jgi:hypothetical protein
MTERPQLLPQGLLYVAVIGELFDIWSAITGKCWWINWILTWHITDWHTQYRRRYFSNFSNKYRSSHISSAVLEFIWCFRSVTEHSRHL